LVGRMRRNFYLECNALYK